MIVCITEQGTKISRAGRRLIVAGRETRQTLFAEGLEQLLLFGNVSLTPPALHLLLREGIDTVFLRLDGRFMGRLANPEPANVELRKRQFLLTGDAAFCLRAARAIVRAKLLNQAALMGRVWRGRQEAEAALASRELRELARKCRDAPSLESLRGLEGSGAALYFRRLHLAFHEDWGFSRRVRRPPTDPVNVVLSLLYTLLASRCHAAVRVAGLDPYPGVFHSLSCGRAALPLDLMEEFRPVLADTLAVALFNLKTLSREDFVAAPPEEEEAGEDDRADALADPFEKPEPRTAAGNAEPEASSGERLCRPALLLRPDAFRKVLGAFARKLETEVRHPLAGKRMTYAQALIFQARLYRGLVEGGRERYAPLLAR